MVCCGGPAPPKSSADARPGYTLCRFIEQFLAAPVGPVPIVSTRRNTSDLLGTVGTRLGLNRNNYLVAPGLYGVGSPDQNSPVLVTANYKLSFDSLRFAVPGLDAWLLVLDTCGINVWCAAGKRTFSTDELVHQVKKSGLEKLVEHRRLIVPQLGAPGISGREVKARCGFTVQFGPLRATDIKAWAEQGFKISDNMREVTFTLKERAVLIPVEFHLVAKSLWWLFPLLFLLSGLGPSADIIGRMVSRGQWMMLALLIGFVSGIVLVSLLLPWLPGRSFALKGAVAGFFSALVLLFLNTGLSPVESWALIGVAVALSSYLGMNFTGSTPYTSPSGVEWEMRRAIPVQFCLSVVALLLWCSVPFFIS